MTNTDLIKQAKTKLAEASALLDQVVDVPTATTPRFAFRGIFCRDTEFVECVLNLSELGINAMECWTGPNSNNALARMNQLNASTLGWTVLGSFRASTSGGAFTMNDQACASFVQSIANHPRNSHRYYIVDDTGNDMRSFTTAQKQLNLSKLRARRDLIKRYDSLAIVNGSDYRQEQLQSGLWVGTLDEVLLDAYPSPNVYVAPDVIPNMAAWCDAVNMPYSLAVSAHDYQGNNPSYPTEAQFSMMMEQCRKTKARDIYLYIWYDAEGTYHLSKNPAAPLAGWDVIKQEMLAP